MAGGRAVVTSSAALTFYSRERPPYDTRMTATLPRTDDPSDLDLVERWKSGDERAATLIVERHAPALGRYALNLGVREDVEEVVQDTFVRAFAAIDSFRGESSMRTWLFTIERRLVLDRARSEKRRGMQLEIEESDLVTSGDALGDIVASETEGRILAAVARLSPTQREVFTLRVGEGLSYREIADVAGTTEGAARVHYHNALRIVKESIDADE